MKDSKLFKSRLLILAAVTMILVSCYRIGKVYSPKTVDPNTTYSARILVVNDNNSDPQTGYSMFSVCVPSNWTVAVKEGALKQYGQAGAMIDGKWDVNAELDMVYSPNYSLICNQAFPREGYEWVGFRTKNIYRRSLNPANGGCDSIAIDFDVLNNGVAGDYEIDYIVGNIESNDENPDIVETWTGDPLKSDLFTTATFGVEGTDFKKVYAEGHSIVTVKEGGTPTYITPKVSVSKNSIGAAEFACMKPTAFFINTARGTIVDENALIEALKEGKIAGAGLDVTVEEPTTMDNPLFGFENVIMTPHNAGSSEDALVRASMAAAKGCYAVINGLEVEEPAVVVK